MFVFNTIVVATHRRSGTQWAIDALRHNSPDINDSYMTLEQIEPDHDANIPLAKFRRQLLNLNGRVLINVHDLPSGTFWQGMDERLFARTILNNSPTVFVHRDGRDVMVSLYYYMQSFSETVRNQSFSQFLRADAAGDRADTGVSRPGYWAFHSQSWLKKANLLAISYDDLETQYEPTVAKLAAFLGVSLHQSLQPLSLPGPPANERLLNSLLGKLALRRRRGANPDQPRVGRSGDWRSHFNKRDHEFFIKEAGEMLRALGYAK